MSLIKTILLVLQGEEVIPELPMDQLLSIEAKGEMVNHTFPQKEVIKIARLQTLIIREQERAEMPDHEVLKQQAEEQRVAYVKLAAKALGIQEDATHNIMMLERLIVETVRDVAPLECDRFGAVYFIDSSPAVRWRTPPQQRFLD